MCYAPPCNLPRKTAPLIRKLRVYESPITHATYKEIPSGYILTTNDQAFKHDYQLQTVKMTGFPKERMLTMETGHMPFLTQPDKVKQFVLHIADGTI